MALIDAAGGTRILTYEEWLALPPVEDGTDEVVKGELRFMPPTRQPHAEILRRLARIFDRALDERQAVAYNSSVEVHLLTDGRLERSAILAEGALHPVQFPQVSVSIPTLFPE